jgi:putative oxidoreductase
MSNILFSPQPLWRDDGLAILRIITGALMIYHGLEIFDRTKMLPYLDWDVIKSLPAPETLLYIGKSLEFVTGLCFMLGLFTRIAALFMAIDMLFICFKVGGGKFWYEDQHPFLFAMLALVFFFTGPVKWSLDKVWFNKR